MAGWFTSGVGLTVTVAVIGVPTQVPEVGVIIKVTVIGTLLGLVSVPLILPVPLFAIPVTTGLSLVQAYVVLATVLVSTMVVIAVPEQVVWDAGVAVALGIGLTTTVAVIGVPVQVNPALV